MKNLPLLALLSIALVGCDASIARTEDALNSGPPFPPVTSFEDRGSFPVTNEAGGDECRIYRPRVLGQLGRKHPIILWGNGTAGFPLVYAGLFNTLASQGFIVAAANTSNAGTGVEMLACLDWLVAENTRTGSVYLGKVDTQLVGASGHSQGGGGAIMVGRDPRIVATAPLLPYTQGLGYQPGAETTQAGPMLLLSGGTDIIAPSSSNQAPIFAATNVPVFWATLFGTGHLAALGDAGRFRGPIVAWFRYQLMDDELAATWFEGDACVLCESWRWTVQKRDL